MSHFSPLPLNRAAPGTSLPLDRDLKSPRLTPEDLALPLMQDVRSPGRVTVRAGDRVESALDAMVRAGARSAFVMSDGPVRTLVGFVTSADIRGEKPIRYLQSVDCNFGTCSRDDVRVEHIMEPIDSWQVVELSALRCARIGQVSETLRAAGKRYVLVVEDGHERGVPVVCGVLSASDLESATGMPLLVTQAARTFHDIEQALA